MEQGPVEKTIIQQCINQRLPLPQKIANAPELQKGLELYFTGFLELSSCRQISFSEGPIPWTAIDRYCVANDITGEQRDDFFYHIKQLDIAYIDYKNKKLDQKSPIGKGASRGKPHRVR